MPMPASHKKNAIQGDCTSQFPVRRFSIVRASAQYTTLEGAETKKKCCVDPHLLFIASWVKKFDSAINKTVTVFVITFYLEHYIGKIC